MWWLVVLSRGMFYDRLEILKFIFIPGHLSAGVKVNCVSAVTLYYLGCKFLIIIVLVDMTLGIGENSYELNSTLNHTAPLHHRIVPKSTSFPSTPLSLQQSFTHSTPPPPHLYLYPNNTLFPTTAFSPQHPFPHSIPPSQLALHPP